MVVGWLDRIGGTLECLPVRIHTNYLIAYIYNAVNKIIYFIRLYIHVMIVHLLEIWLYL
ncbi:hypothetical protein J2746_002148 [Methanolobus bombayensis]|nr:hypothetical protein [Methanolobus bombayensis]